MKIQDISKSKCINQKINNLGISIVLPPEIAESHKDVSTSTNDFIGNVCLCTAQARMLTGINAIYVPRGNYFTMPITILLGGLRSKSGHEVSHGFNQCVGIEVSSNYINNVNGAHTITDIGENIIQVIVHWHYTYHVVTKTQN